MIALNFKMSLGKVRLTQQELNVYPTKIRSPKRDHYGVKLGKK